MQQTDAIPHSGVSFEITVEQRLFFQQNGYLRLPGVLNEITCDAIIGHIWTLLPPYFSTDPKSWVGRIQDCCNNLPLYQRKGLVRFKDAHGFRKVPAVRDGIYDNDRLTATFEDLLGRPLERMLVRGLHPNFPMAPWISLNEALGNRVFAQQTTPNRSLLRIPRPPLLPVFGHLDAHAMELGAIVYLNDIGSRAGGLAVWPGSHRLFEHTFESKIQFLPTKAYKRALNFFQRYRPIILEGRKGDVFFFHNRLMHSNSYNFSQNVRQAILLDALGKDWKNKDDEYRQMPPDAALRDRLAKTKKIELCEPAQSIVQQLTLEPVSNFLVDHPRLRGALERISKDPIGSARRKLSRKIRGRTEGDYWIVISQAGDHAASYKLDAYGDVRKGRYDLFVNGERFARSDGGTIVERLELSPDANTVRISGLFQVDHYLRIVKTANPLHNSPIIATKVIAAGSVGCEVTVRLSHAEN